MSSRLFPLTLFLLLGLMTWQICAPAEAQQRQPQRVVHRPAAGPQYGFPVDQGSPFVGDAARGQHGPNARPGRIAGDTPTPARARLAPRFRGSADAVRPVSYSGDAYRPYQEAIQGQPIIDGELGPEPLMMDPIYPDGEAYYDGEYLDYDDHGFGGFLPMGSCFSGRCAGDYCDPYPECFWRGFGGLISNADYRIGVQGFKNAANRQQDGSFGYHGGVNLGLPLTRLSCGLFSGSLGVNSVQSNFSGSSFTEENRNQLFVTAAAFRRVDQGLQGGIAYDYLREDWYSNFGISQIRSELSWVTEAQNVFGFRFTKAQASYTTNSVLIDATGAQSVLSENWVGMRQYRFFGRKSTRDGDGYVEFSAGHTDEKHAILALDFNTQVRGMMRFYGGFTYLVPQENIVNSTNGQETWNVAMGLQFSPYRQRGHCRFNVPMFDVADNGTFQVIRQPR